SKLTHYNNVSLRSDGWLSIELRTPPFQLVSIDANGSDRSTSASVRVEVFGPPERHLRVRSLHNLMRMNVEMVWAALEDAEKRRRGGLRTCASDPMSSLRNVFQPVVFTAFYPLAYVRNRVQTLAQDDLLLPACINAIALAPMTGVHNATILRGVTVLEEADTLSATIVTLSRSMKVTLVGMEATCRTLWGDVRCRAQGGPTFFERRYGE
ncbi:hypothetical protein K488DRAFT_58983, partial [Vararia minispora EC-137]